MPSTMHNNTNNSSHVDVMEKAETIERKIVSDGTLPIYSSRFVNFMLFLHDNHPTILKVSALREMKAEDRIDKATTNLNSSGRRKRKSKAKIQADTAQRKHLRAYCKNCFAKLSPPENGAPYYCPIRLEGQNRLSYSVVRSFMMIGRRIQIVDKEIAEQYLRDKNKDVTLLESAAVGNSKVKLAVQQSASQYEGIRSSISYLYKMTRVVMPDEMANNLRSFIAGQRRTGSKEKQDLGLTILEGKRPISSEAYELVCKHFFYSGKPEHVFAHLFNVLDWNLMKRAENCVNAKINHIYFRHDALVFDFAKSKGHQKGESHLGPWHIYANPRKPWMCPLLALSRYLFCYPEILKGDMPLFEGNAQYNRYAMIYHKAILDLEPDLNRLGFTAKDLGSHSNRKGVATMVASGCTVCPPIIAICIRAGWAMGGVKDKYLTRADAGDQYVGRCASLLSQVTKEFAVSPPYFDFTGLCDEEKIARKKEIRDFLRERLPFFSGSPARSLHVAEMAFATLCYHSEHLKKEMHEGCPLQTSVVYRDMPQSVLDLVRVAYPWDKTEDTPQFTGIPPHILILAELEELKQVVLGLQNNIKDDMKDLMEERGFSSQASTTQSIIDAVSKNNKEMLDDIIAQTNLSVSRVEQQVESNGNANSYFIDELEETERNSLETNDDGNAFTQEEDLHISRVNREMNRKIVQRRKFTIGLQRGILSPLPPDFNFTTMTTPHLITNWLIGNVSLNIPPLSSISPAHIRHTKNALKKWNSMKVLMAYIEKVGRKVNLWKNRLSDWTYADCNILWSSVGMDYFMNIFAKGSKRKKEITWKTLYNKMSKEGVFKEAEIRLPLSSCQNPSGMRNPPPDCGVSATPTVAQKRSSSRPSAFSLNNCSSTTSACNRKLPVTSAASKRKRPAGSHNAATTTLQKRQRRSGEKVVITKFRNAPVANECDYCHQHTSNHYCHYPVKGSNFTIDGEGIEICGRLACIHCKEEWVGGSEQYTNRCSLHPTS